MTRPSSVIVSALYKTKPKFLNVDLQIESEAPLGLLETEFGEKIMILYSDKLPNSKRNVLILEIRGRNRGVDETIEALCKLIDKLSPKARRIWEKARKEFDVGYELRPSQRSSRFTLRHDSLQRIANLGANLAVTYYRGEPPTALEA